MFNFEEWSEKVFRIIDRIELDGGSKENASGFQEELNDLWLEMFQHQNDDSVQFLQNVLSNTRSLMDGKMNKEDFEEIISGMRDMALNS